MDVAALPGLAPQALARALALPAECYTDATLAAIERRQVFGRGWQFVAHANEVPDPGSFLATEMAGLPVVLLRNEAGELRAFHNVCRHRAGPVAQGRGCARRLRCVYHGWSYGLDGQLRSATEMDGAEDFDPQTVRLPELSLATWQGLVFLSEQPEVPLAAVVEGMDERFGSRRLDHYRHHRQVRYRLACNWKVYVDNYLEGYHVPHLHPGLNRLLDYRSYITETRPWHSYQYSPMESATLYGDGDALYYYLWPNTMLNSLPDRLQTNRVLPHGIDHCEVVFDYYYPADPADPEAQQRCAADVAFSDEVQAEDADICIAVQQGLASGGYSAGRLNPRWENAVHHFHELLRAAYAAGRPVTDA
ncbi:MAG: aromatic ring-hydroxylating dioxygenase subunit alpha [Lysobacterales bacterium]